MRTYERNKGRGVIEVIEVGDDLVAVIEDARDAEWQRRLMPLHEGFNGDGCDSGDPIDWSVSALGQARTAPDNKLFDTERERDEARALAEKYLQDGHKNYGDHLVERERLEAELNAARATVTDQLQVTVTARQAVADMVVQRNAARAEVEKLRAELATVRADTAREIGNWIQNKRADIYEQTGGDLRSVASMVRGWTRDA